jgi:thiosulfate reductase cytochrome b subunit
MPLAPAVPPDRSERTIEMTRTYVHPLPVRLWHWINAFGFVLMILTGIQIRYVGLIDVI